MNNPYFDLHRKFRQAGAEVLISSGQACVAFGIAAFSKDGDWIIRKDSKSCAAVLEVLAGEGAQYRLGAPLAPEWLNIGWTSHFEYRNKDGIRIRADFCARPPRVHDIDTLWNMAVKVEGLDVVDIEHLLRIKQTRRLRDYPIIGALAETTGLEQGAAHIALEYLQDYRLLDEAVRRWPQAATEIEREAVRLLLAGANRRDVVIALAVEQDKLIQEDEARIQALQISAGAFPQQFIELRQRWRRCHTKLLEQHDQLKELAVCLLNQN